MAKLGLELWVVERPKGIPKHTMLVGADVFHNIGKNRKSIVGLCCTINQNFSKYYSISHVQEKKA